MTHERAYIEIWDRIEQAGEHADSVAIEWNHHKVTLYTYSVDNIKIAVHVHSWGGKRHYVLHAMDNENITPHNVITTNDIAEATEILLNATRRAKAS